MSLKKSVEAEIMSQIFESQMKSNPDKWKVLILDRLTTLILSGMQLRLTRTQKRAVVKLARG